MTAIATFVFNGFQENTYLVYDSTKDCIVIDPGCHSPEEKTSLKDYIKNNDLKPVALINTHCHLDHIFGNRFVAMEYGLELTGDRDELPNLQNSPLISKAYGVEMDPSPEMKNFLSDGNEFKFGNTELKILSTPGHSNGGISLWCEKEGFIIVGDVLFKESIGRYDLPGGDPHVLMTSINDKLLQLDDAIEVYPGHGPKTTIGHERVNNPFITYYRINKTF